MFDLTEYRADGSFHFVKLYFYTKREALARLKALPHGGALYYPNGGDLIRQVMPEEN